MIAHAEEAGAEGGGGVHGGLMMDLQGVDVSLGQLLITALRMERLKLDVLIMSTCSSMRRSLGGVEVS